MKKITTEVEIKFERSNCISTYFGHYYEYTFSSKEPLDFDKMKFIKEEEEPENMGEFRKLNNISSKELLKWLKENYN